ncbi:MAG: NAD(P)H-quinone oxidoreductase [Pseudomonadales bacterium]|nr:NAD(P)H-quinone oxidoreductase [Pseudomonadales bacterium]
MKAILINDDKALNWSTCEDPTMGADEVTITVKATAVNRADLMQIAGLYPPPPGASDILGLECSGVIEAVGDAVTEWQVGDKVCALLAGGGYAEKVVCKASHCLPIPNGFSFNQAAALPEVFATAWLNIFMEAGIQTAEPVLIHAGASGVGTAAIQLCNAFDNPCFVTVGSGDKLEQCIALGAQAGHIRHDGDFIDAAKAFSKGKGFKAILDPVGGQYLESNLKSLATDGALVIIGLMGGRSANLDIGRLLVKRLRVIGSTLRSRSDHSKAQVIAELRQKVWPLFDTQTLKPIIDQEFAIADAAEAIKEIQSNQTVGKVVLEIPS